MPTKLFRSASWNVGTRISAITFALTGLCIAALLAAVTITVSSMLTERAETGVGSELRSVANTIEMFDRSVGSEARSFAKLFRASLPGEFGRDAVDGSLTIGGRPAAQETAAVDAFATHSGGSATLFALQGDDFVSVVS